MQKWSEMDCKEDNSLESRLSLAGPQLIISLTLTSNKFHVMPGHSIPIWKRLHIVTVTISKEYLIVTVTTFRKYLIVTVTISKKYLIVTVTMFKEHHIVTLSKYFTIRSFLQTS